MEDDTHIDENGDDFGELLQAGEGCDVFILITRGRLHGLETELEEAQLRIRYLEAQLKKALEAHAAG